MNLEEIEEYNRHEYQEECDNCGLTSKILSSYNDTPEYDQDLWVKCACGNYIHFVIPIN